MHPGGSSDKKGKSQIEKIVIEYHPEAADEFIEAAQFYESREKGQGDQMGRRKYVVKKFPYLLIYLDRSHPDQRQLKFLLIKKYLTSTTVGEFKQLFVFFIITYAHGNGFAAYGNDFSGYVNGFAAYGNDFAGYGNDFAHFGGYSMAAAIHLRVAGDCLW